MISILRSIKQFFRFWVSAIIAFLRLLVLEVLLFISGINQIFFIRKEVCAVEIRVLPLRCDREDSYNNLSYIDRLCAENPDLAEYTAEEMANEDLPAEDTDDDDDLDNFGDSNT